MTYTVNCPVCNNEYNRRTYFQIKVLERNFQQELEKQAKTLAPEFTEAERSLMYQAFAYILAGETGGTPLEGDDHLRMAELIMERLST